MLATDRLADDEVVTYDDLIRRQDEVLRRELESAAEGGDEAED